MNFQNFWDSFIINFQDPASRAIIMSILVLLLIDVYSHFKIYFYLKSEENDFNSIDNRNSMEVINEYDYSDIKSYIEKYYSNVKIFLFEKLPMVGMMDFIKMTVSLFIILGVLGTFYSLVISFDDIKNIFGLNEFNSGDMQNIGQVLEKMSIAFHTSIVGMIASIILSLVTKIFNTEYKLTKIMYSMEKYLEKNNSEIAVYKENKYMTETLGYLMETRDGIFSIKNTLNSFENFTGELDNATMNMQIFNTSLGGSVDKYSQIFEGLNNFVNNFEKGLGRLNENFEGLFEYFQVIEDERKAYNQNLIAQQNKSDYQIEILNEIRESIINTLEGSDKKNKEWIEHLVKYTEDINGYLDGVRVMYENLNTRNSEFEQTSMILMDSINNGFINNLNNFEEKINYFNEQLEKVISQIDTSLNTNTGLILKKLSTYLDISQNLLVKKLDSLNDISTYYQKNGDKKIDEIFHSITIFNDRLKQINKLLGDNINQSQRAAV